ncbi:hypothetical protein DYQ86_08495 [Acidobacteria bacterium AB60]|nr:hypothetical protein DYQ86_08495 [Acidobacteria bacterium AB60]
MNWARGLKFAGIHVVIAIPLIASKEIPRWETEKTHSEVGHDSLVLAGFQEEPSTVEFSPACEEWRSYSSAEKLLAVSETPALIVSGWNNECPPSWTIAGMVGIDMKHRSLTQRSESGFGLCSLIALQWVLLAGFPLVKPRRRWLEPGVANTFLTLIAIPLLLLVDATEWSSFGDVRSVAVAVGFPALLVLLLIFSTWLAWLGLIAERLVRFGWRAAIASLRWACTS